MVKVGLRWFQFWDITALPSEYLTAKIKAIDGITSLPFATNFFQLSGQKQTFLFRYQSICRRLGIFTVWSQSKTYYRICMINN